MRCHAHDYAAIPFPGQMMLHNRRGRTPGPRLDCVAIEGAPGGRYRLASGVNSAVADHATPGVGAVGANEFMLGNLDALQHGLSEVSEGRCGSWFAIALQRL